MKGMAREEAPDSHPLLPQLVAIMNSFCFNGEFWRSGTQFLKHD